MHALAALAPVTLGPDWMDPAYLLEQYGGAFFWIALAIVFIECGLLFPILPGDSLLFSIGLFVHRAQAGEAGIDVNIWAACAILSAAAFIGNVVGYEIGRAIGEPLAQREGRFIKKKYFDQTHEFFERYGWMASPAFTLARTITAPSEFLASAIRERFGVTVSIVPNILDSSRFVYRARTGAPPPVATLTTTERIASGAVHHLLYVLLLVVPVLGWAGVSAYGAREVFGLFSLPPLLPANQALGETILKIHGWAALTMAALVVAHLGGALMHGLIKQDGVMNRMIGWWPLRK